MLFRLNTPSLLCGESPLAERGHNRCVSCSVHVDVQTENRGAGFLPRPLGTEPGGWGVLGINCSHGEGVLPVKESRFEQASMLCVKDIGFSRLHTDLKFKKKKKRCSPGSPKRHSFKNNNDFTCLYTQ